MLMARQSQVHTAKHGQQAMKPDASRKHDLYHFNTGLRIRKYTDVSYLANSSARLQAYQLPFGTEAIVSL